MRVRFCRFTQLAAHVVEGVLKLADAIAALDAREVQERQKREAG